MTEQIPLRFDYRPSTARRDFALGGCNALAADWIDRWPDWPGRIKGLVIHGPADCGKSHLAAIWAAASGAITLNHIDALTPTQAQPHVILHHPSPDRCDEDTLFHLLNRLPDYDGSVLIESRAPINQYHWCLPDLASRLKALVSIEITPPDDAVLVAVMQKIADDLGLYLAPDLIQYTASRMERSFAMARKIIEAIDTAAQASKKRASIAMVREIIESLEPKLL